jgi:hypothetical protein
MSKITLGTTIERSNSQVSTEVEGETVILQLESGNYFSLNEVGAFIWGELTQPQVVQDLCTRVLEEFDVEGDECERDVMKLLEQLLTEEMIALG